MEYGQFCPIAKASEILSEKWTLLIIRELLMGGSRFNELQRGLPLISPTLLSKRLDYLNKAGLVVKKRIVGSKGYEYFPTDSCRELQPILFSIGEWGMRWARNNLSDNDYDVELLMLYLKRSIIPEKLPQADTVIRFKFTDIDTYSDWWIVVASEQVDLCVNDPGKDVDVYFTSTVKRLAQVWMGDSSYRQAIKDNELTIVGNSSLTKNVSNWLTNSMFAGLPPAQQISA